MTTSWLLLGYVSHHYYLAVRFSLLLKMLTAKLCMLVSVSLRTVVVQKPGGTSLFEVPPDLRVELGRLNAIAGPLAIGAAMLSKTSFALTLLRVVMGRLRILLWAIIVSMNVALFLSVLILFISCKPIEKGWNPELPGKCWPSYIGLRYGVFSSG